MKDWYVWRTDKMKMKADWKFVSINSGMLSVLISLI